MPLTREERKLLHQKSKEPTFGTGNPDNNQGLEGDLAFRKISGSGTVQYIKQSHEWIPMSSSGTMPPVRIGSGGGGTSAGTGGMISSHPLLDDLDIDGHTQYLLVDGTRAMDSVLTMGSDADGTDRSITWGHSTLKTIMGIDDSSDAFVINTDDAFDATLANNSFSIDASHNVIIAGDVSVGDDLFLTSSGSIVNWNSGDVTLTHASGKLTFGGDGTVELDFNNHEMTNVDIDSGAIDATPIGATNHTTIKGTTIDATTDFTIGGTVMTANQLQMTPSVSDTATISAAANGVLNIVTVDAAAAAGHINIVADGTLSLKASSAARAGIVIDGTSRSISMNQYETAYGTIITHGATTVAANYEEYRLQVLGDTYFFTQGEGDFEQNYSMLSSHEEVATGVTYPGE